MAKECQYCGLKFEKPRKYSKSQWEKTLYCSPACSGAMKVGSTHTTETRLKLMVAHKGKKKPWAGRYKHSEEHKLAVSETLKSIHASELGNVIRKKISLANLGRKRSLETIEKIKAIWQNRPDYRGGIKTFSKRRSFYQGLREYRKINNGGTHSLEEWDSLKARFGFTCPSCNRPEPEIKLTRDHIIPLTKGGTNNIENIQPLCNSCNSSKHTKIIKYEKENCTAE